MQKDLSKFEEKIGFIFNDKNLLRQVFVHRSYINESPGFDLDHNERLEFLGDAVLELVVTEYLYKNYKNPEGELTNWRAALVRGAMLSELAAVIEMEEFLYLSKGEAKSAGKARQIILANAFEALIGAIYLDQGYEASSKFIEKNLLYRLEEILEKKLYIDSKSRLQEIAQEQKGITPNYSLLKEFGPDHSKSFTIGVFLGDNLLGEGSGSSKQAAEQAAASNALENWKE
ncbi:MAG: ribonuclease III [Patescibacteria group bacterium]|jgi:ribonuclease-3